MIERIACFSPLPPSRSGIADYSRELLPELAKRVEIVLFVEEPERLQPALAKAFEVQPLSLYPALRGEFDLALYQMGNSREHAAFYRLFLDYPGVVVLHDLVLHHLVKDMSERQDGGAAYHRALCHALGDDGLALGSAIDGGLVAPPWFSLPLNEGIVRRSLGVVVHSQYVAGKLEKQYDGPVAVVPALIRRYPAESRRPELDWPEDWIIFASAGQVTKAKQLEMALRAFTRLRAQNEKVGYLIIGEALPAEVDLPALLEDPALEGAVHVTGYVPSLAAFVDWIASADVVVNLRHPTAGETSATALRGMAAGRPLIVFNHGWYVELPDQACIKVAPMDEDGLLAAMRRLAGSAELRREMGGWGERHVAAYHAPERVVDTYVTALEGILSGIMSKLHA